MKVTYNWLKDFVEIRIPAEKLAEKLTMAGIEVTGLEQKEGDFVFEIEITSNRPDWLSIAGIAREAAAVTGRKLKITPSPQPPAPRSREGAHNLRIEIADKNGCPFYTATVIKDVRVGPSPDWLRKRLELIGCRPVNNIVDITNYVLFEWGQPLHAFDLDKLASLEIIVRRAKEREKIETIDEQARTLTADILVIADSARPQAIAGIMGARDSEVSLATKNILLEAAIFNPTLIRRSRKKLGIESESSYRFERGMDLERLDIARNRAISLIQETSGGKIVSTQSVGLAEAKKKTITLTAASLNKILGISITAAKIKTILNNLGFRVQPKGKKYFVVTVPLYRQDVNLEIDLIEEIARIYGYERIPNTLPKITPEAPTIRTARDTLGLVKTILVGMGLNEVVTYSLIDRDCLEDLGLEDSTPLEIANPLSREQELLRPTILPGLVECVAANLHQKQDYINIFEVGKIFSVGSSGLPKEKTTLAIASCGEKSWLLNQGRVMHQIGLLDLKGQIGVLLSRLGIKDYDFQMSAPCCVDIYVNPVRKESSNGVKKIKVGLMRELDENILERFEIKNKKVVVAEVSLDLVFAQVARELKFTALPQYPGILRDISILLKEEIPASQILDEIRVRGGVLLVEVKIKDFYQGKQIPAGFKGLTISCFYRSRERTLTEAEVAPTQALILQALKDKFNVGVR